MNPLLLSTYSIRSFFPAELSVGTALILLIVAIALIFAGRHIIRVIAFLAVGLVVAAIGAAFGGLVLGIFGLLIGGILGFIIGGFLSLVLLPIALGIGLGVIAYNLTQTLAHIYVLSVIVGVIVFFVGVAISSKLLALATAVFGSLILFNVMIFFQLPNLTAAIAAVTLGAIGFFVQGGLSNRQGARFVNARMASPVTPTRPPMRNVTPGDSTTICRSCGARIPGSAEYCPSCGSKQPT